MIYYHGDNKYPCLVGTELTDLWAALKLLKYIGHSNSAIHSRMDMTIALGFSSTEVCQGICQRLNKKLQFPF